MAFGPSWAKYCFKNNYPLPAQMFQLDYKENMEKNIVEMEESAKISFDPHPEEEERIQCQKAYFKLLQDLKCHQKSIIHDPNDHTLFDILDESNQLFKGIKRPLDSLLDSKVLMLGADLGNLRVKNLPIVGCPSYSADDLNGDLKSLFPTTEEFTEQIDFGLLGRRLKEASVWKGVSIKKNQLSSLQVPLFKREMEATESQPKEKKKRKVRVDNSTDAKTEIIAESGSSSLNNETETFDYVRQVYFRLEELGGSVSLFPFVIDPDSFARSVENMFYASFLVKEDRVKLIPKDPDNIQIEIINEDDELEAEEKKQLVLDLTMQRWQHLINIFKIKSPMLNF